MITPADVGLECEAEAVRVWRSPRALSRKRVFHSSPAIRYRHIYECKSFSVSPIKRFCISTAKYCIWFSHHTAALKCLSDLHHYYIIAYIRHWCKIYSHIIPACRLEYFAYQHHPSSHSTTILEWLYSAKFYMARRMSNHMTGLTQLNLLTYQKVEFS